MDIPLPFISNTQEWSYEKFDFIQPHIMESKSICLDPVFLQKLRVSPIDKVFSI